VAHARLIFGRIKGVRPLAPGPLVGHYTKESLRLARPRGVTLQGWSANPRNVSASPGRVVIYFPGRNEHAAWAADMASHVEDAAIYAFNFRGGGGSSGAPSESAAKADALAIHDLVRERHGGSLAQMVLMGRSLGTAIALWLARRVQPRELVLVSPFDSIRAVLNQRPLGRVAGLLLGQTFECTSAASQVDARTLVLLAGGDREVPNERSLRLCSHLPSAPQIRILQGVTHQSLPRSVEAQRALAEFLAVPALRCRHSAAVPDA